MTKFIKFTFNPFQENTYIVYDETHTCVIIDPGMYSTEEEEMLFKYIEQHGLKPALLLNTHCHLDHIFGNAAILKKYAIPFYAHHLELKNLQDATAHAAFFNVKMDSPPLPDKWITAGEDIIFGNTTFNTLFTPGHSAGSVSFYCEKQKWVFSGDALFHSSIGRTDLPGGNFETLINSIKNQLFTLPAETLVLSGHGPETDIEFEQLNNPFLN